MSTSTLDYYNTDNAWYYILQIVHGIYFLAIIPYFILILNAIGAPINWSVDLPGGVEESLRYSSVQWAVYMLSGFKILMVFILPLAVTWRRSRLFSLFFYGFILLLVLVDAFVFVGLVRLWGTCNDQGQRNNPCNDLLWGCAVEIYSNPSNKVGAGPCICPPLPDPCPVFPTTIGELRPNADFLWYFFVNLIFMLLDGFILAFFSGMLYVRPLPGNVFSKIMTSIGGQVNKASLGTRKKRVVAAGDKMTKVI